MNVRLDPEEWKFPYNSWGREMLAILDCIKYFRQPQLKKVREIVEAMREENFKERERVKRYGENNPASYGESHPVRYVDVKRDIDFKEGREHDSYN